MEQATSVQRDVPAPRGSGGELAAAMARRSAAFDAGEDAFWNGSIGADAYMLYRLLVRLCREQSWCWPGLHWLAERTRVSVGTIKRRLEELERAGLIARRQRPGGLTARTIVLALGQDMVTAGIAAPAAISPEPAAPQQANAFFCAGEATTDAPADGSALISHTMESQTTNGGGEGESDTARLLRQAGVLSPRVRAELEHRPSDEVARCIAIARQQPNIKDPAALAVTLLRTRTGQQDGQRQKLRFPSPQRSTTQRSRTGRAVAACDEAVDYDRATDVHTSDAQIPTPYAAIWRDVRSSLVRTLDAAALATWFADAQVALISERLAVLVVGNVLARSWIREHASNELSAAFCTALGRDVAVAVEIS